MSRLPLTRLEIERQCDRITAIGRLLQLAPEDFAQAYRDAALSMLLEAVEKIEDMVEEVRV